MQAKIDSVGRLVLPKPLREAVGLKPGSEVTITRYGAGLNIVPGARTARLVEENGRLVIAGDTPVSDDDVFQIIDELRR